MPFRHSTSWDGVSHRLELVGPVGASGTAELVRLFDQLPDGPLAVDLERCAFLSGPAIIALLRERDGRVLWLEHATSQVEELVELHGAGRLLDRPLRQPTR